MARRKSFYWTAFTRSERKLLPTLNADLDMSDELALLRVRILEFARPEPGADRVERTRLMLGMLEALARLGMLQARLGALNDPDVAALNAALWTENQ